MWDNRSIIINFTYVRTDAMYKYIPLYDHYTGKNNKILVKMSCTEYTVYTFHLSLHHAKFGQFKAKQVL